LTTFCARRDPEAFFSGTCQENSRTNAREQTLWVDEQKYSAPYFRLKYKIFYILSLFVSSTSLASPFIMADILAATETDMKQMLSAKCHLGTKTVDPNMRRYMWTRKKDGLRSYVQLRDSDSKRGTQTPIKEATKRGFSSESVSTRCEEEELVCGNNLLRAPLAQTIRKFRNRLLLFTIRLLEFMNRLLLLRHELLQMLNLLLLGADEWRS
jgi:hypothetical protein